ncbi:PREDICTED: glutamate receptor 2.8-like [Fragaria vesca subsp. vesca]
MANQKSFMRFIFIILFSSGIEPSMTKEVIRVPVGVVLKLNSPVGAMAENCMAMALDDFYTKQAHYQTRLFLLTRDSKNDVVSAALEALHLINKENVTAIIGPQSSAEAKFVIELGRTKHVPIISFSATSPSLSPSHNPFFIRSAFNDYAQVKAIAAIVGAYSWLEVVLIYEDTEYGNSLVPYLVDAFQQVGARVPNRSVIPLHSNDTEILKELDHLKSTRARIFVVHMTASLGSRFFFLASQSGMMTKGYGWIVTEGLSTLLYPVGSKAMQSMKGVLGVRPYIPMSKEVEDFVLRMKRFRFRNPSNINGVNLFGLWAYDTVWALAMAVEKVGIANYSFTTQNVSTSKVDLTSLGTGDMGQHLLEAILDSKFESLISGNFRLVKGELEASTFEVFNVNGEKERIIGYWNQKKGLTRKLNGAAQLDGRKTIKTPIWPGDTTKTPPTKKLRIGVPVKHGFNEFLKVDEKNNKISGFSYDIFIAVVKQLPFPIRYEFSTFDGTYDDLLYQIHLQAFPLGSSLVSYMSRAILNVTQDKTLMDEIQSKSFDYQPACEDQRAKIASEGPSLGISSFGGLFIIAGVASMVALLMHMYHFLCSHWPAFRTICSSESTFWAKLVEMAKHFDKKDLTSHQFKRRDSRVHATDIPDDEGPAAAPDANDMQNNSSRTHETVENDLDINENENLSSGSGRRDSSMPVLDSS